MRRADKMALWTAALLATWVNVAINLVVWEGVPLVRHALGWHMAEINYQLSVWPVLVDVIILMATMAITRQQLKAQEAQTALMEAVHHLVQSEQARGEREERTLQTMQQYDKATDRDIDEILAILREQKARVSS